VVGWDEPSSWQSQDGLVKLLATFINFRGSAG
jgi:hypothetical protein